MATSPLLRIALLAAWFKPTLQLHMVAGDGPETLIETEPDSANAALEDEDGKPIEIGRVQFGESWFPSHHKICAPESRLAVDRSVVALDNLCGNGPDPGEEGLRISNVFPERKEPVDLLISCLSEYASSDPIANGLNKPVGVLNLEGGTKAKFGFNFVDRAGRPVEISVFGFSMVNLGTAKGGTAVESFTTSGFGTAVISEKSKIGYTIEKKKKSKQVVFKSRDGQAELPRDLFDLSEDQWDESVSLVFRQTSTFTISLDLGEGQQTRNFTYAGATQMLCPAPETCSDFECPAGYELRDNADARSCSGTVCNEIDRDLCCMRKARSECQSQRSLVFKPEALLTSNLAGHGPQSGMASEMLIGNVLPKLEHFGVVDLRITAQPDYMPIHPWDNGVTQDWMLSVGVQCGATALLDFEFLDRDRKPVTVPSFLLSFSDLAIDKHGGIPQVTVVGNSEHFLAKDTEITTQTLDSGLMFSPSGQKALEHVDNFFNMTDQQKAQSVQVLYPSLSQFTLNLTVAGTFPQPDPGCRSIFKIAGANNIVCPGRQACSTYQCSAGWARKKDAHHIPCQEEVCTDGDMETCCDNVATAWFQSSRYTKFSPDNLFYSNLDGKGPDRGMPRSLLLGDVFPHADATIDLEIRTLGSYMSSDTDNNTMIGDMLQINVLGMAKFKFRFLDRATGGLANMESSFYLSFLGLHAMDDHRGMKRLRMNKTKIQSYDLSKNSSMELVKLETFGSRAVTEPWIPKGPMSLTSEEMDTSVVLLMNNEPEFDVELEVLGGARSVNFLIAGCSNIVCPARQSCATFECPRQYNRKANSQFIDCAGTSCEEEDVTTCCEEKLPPECLPGSMLDLSKKKVILNGMGYRVPSASWNGLLMGNVFPDFQTTIDLEVTPIGHYNFSADHTTGATGAMIAFGIEAGTHVDMMFRFFDRETQKPVMSPPFFFTAANLQTGSGLLNVTVAASSSAVVSAQSEVRVQSAQSFGNTLGAQPQSFIPGNAMTLNGEQEKAAVTTHIEATDSFRVTLSASKETNGHTFLFGGASTLVCPKQAVCTTMSCPTGWLLRDSAKHTACSGTVCKTKDISRCCVQKALDLCEDTNRLHITKNNVIYSNLNNLGPDYNQPEGMKLGNVFHSHRHPIDLLIKADENFLPAASQRNGERGNMLNINILGGTKTVLNFTFINRSSNQPQEIPEFYFSIGDFGSDEGGGYELINILTPFSQDTRGTPTAVDKHGSTFVTSTPAVPTFAHPGNLMALTQEEMNFTVTLLFKHVSHFALEVAVNQAYGARNIIFAGASSLVCQKRALCSSLTCPPHHSPREDAETISCNEDTCTEADVKKCCMEEASPSECLDDQRLNLDHAIVLHSNLGGQGPDFGGEQTMAIGNVFPGRDAVIDMVISVAAGALYSPAKASRNGVERSMVRISMPPNMSTTLDLEFVYRANGSRAEVRKFLLSFSGLGIDASKPGQTNVSIAAPDVESYEVGRDASGKDTDDGSIFTAHGKMRDVNHLLTMKPELLTDVVTALMTKPVDEDKGKYTLTLSTKGGRTGRDILFGGASTLMCPMKGSCADFMCPGGFKRREHSSHLACSGEFCDDSDIPRCCIATDQIEGCAPKSRLIFKQGGALYSNLGGQGPDTYAPEGILYGDVLPDSDKVVDLKVTTLDPFDSSEVWASDSAMDGAAGEIGVSPGMSIPVEFAFQTRRGKPVQVPSFWFSFLDLTTLSSDPFHSGRMLVNMSEFEDYRLHEDSELLARGQLIGSSLRATAVESTTLKVDPLALYRSQLKRSVAFLMPPTQSFKAVLTAMPGKEGRMFHFAGATSLTCPRRSPCSTYLCPAGFKSKEHSSHAPCAGAICNDMDDLHTCCVKQESLNCAYSRSFSLRSSHYSKPSPAEEQSPSGVIYHNVFPQAGQPVDLLVQARGMGDSTPIDLFVQARGTGNSTPNRSGLEEGLARINVGYNSSVDLMFEFIAEDGSNVASEGPFYFTFHDLGLSRGNETVALHSSVLNYTVSDQSKVDMRYQDGRPTFTAMPSKENGAALMLLFPGNTSRFLLSLNRSAASTGCAPSNSSCALDEANNMSSGADFRFGDAAQLLCSTRAVCASFKCPSPYTARPFSASVLCKDSACGAEDMYRCCELQ